MDEHRDSAARRERNRVLWRAAVVVVLFGALLVSGVEAFMLVSDDPFTEALYRSLGAVTSANVATDPQPGSEQAITAALAVGGGVFYLVLIAGVVQAVVVRNALREAFRERRAMRDASKMKRHYIVCGYGRVGRALTNLLRERGKQVVVVDLEEAVRAEVDAQGAILIRGDADTQEVLRDANVDSAAALIACTGSDAENVYIALAAKRCHKGLRVIARASDEESERNLCSAKEIIDHVITPHDAISERIRRALLGEVPA